MRSSSSSCEVVEARNSHRHTDSGQVAMFLALVMGIFLVAFVGFATDYTKFWFQRQSVQGAADATCQAAAVDLLLYTANLTNPAMLFTPGSAGLNCGTTSTASPCKIAAYNGYNATLAGVNVALSFPTSLPGVTAAPGVAWPFVTVNITQQAPAYFSSLLTLRRNVNVHASASCGLVSGLGAGSVLVLDPFPQITTVTFSGTGTMKLIGGTAVGMQVNADSIRAVKLNGGTANFSLGGLADNGSDLGVTGTETQPSGFVGGTNGVWLSPHAPSLNPYTSLSTPAGVASGGNGTSTNISSPTDGCSDTTNGCIKYTPGYWPTGISYAGSKTLLFDPGIYYLDGSLSITGTATLRMGNGTTYSQQNGVMFYFHQGTLNIGSTSGTSGTAGSVASTALTCNGSSPPAILGIPASLTGNVLIAQCTTAGTYFDNYGDTTDSVGNIRGVLFFQDYNNSSSTPTLYGNSTSVYTGTEYFHNSTYGVTFTMTSGATDALTAWGPIVVDNLTIAGNNEMKILLGGVGTAPVAKIAMVQ